MDIKDTATLDLIELKSGEWLTVKEMAAKLKVHPDTIRRWSNKGKLKSVRHPINNYRFFPITNYEGPGFIRWVRPSST